MYVCVHILLKSSFKCSEKNSTFNKLEVHFVYRNSRAPQGLPFGTVSVQRECTSSQFKLFFYLKIQEKVSAIYRLYVQRKKLHIYVQPDQNYLMTRHLRRKVERLQRFCSQRKGLRIAWGIHHCFSAIAHWQNSISWQNKSGDFSKFCFLKVCENS